MDEVKEITCFIKYIIVTPAGDVQEGQEINNWGIHRRIRQKWVLRYGEEQLNIERTISIVRSVMILRRP